MTLFRGDISQWDKIPWCQESEETRFLVRLYSKWDFIPWSHQSEGTSFQGDMTVENIPRSRIFHTNIAAGPEYVDSRSRRAVSRDNAAADTDTAACTVLAVF